jgi:hypothetical protein
MFLLPLPSGISNWAIIRTKNSSILRNANKIDASATYIPNWTIQLIIFIVENSTDVLLVTTFCAVKHVPFRIEPTDFEDDSYHKRLRTIMNFTRVLWCVVAGILDAALFNNRYWRVLPNFLVTRLSHAGDIQRSCYIPSWRQRRSLIIACFFFLFPTTECRVSLINCHYRGIYFRFLAVIRDFLYFQSVDTFSGAQPSSYSVGTGGFLPRGKAAGRRSWPLICV